MTVVAAESANSVPKRTRQKFYRDLIYRPERHNDNIAVEILYLRLKPRSSNLFISFRIISINSIFQLINYYYLKKHDSYQGKRNSCHEIYVYSLE